MERTRVGIVDLKNQSIGAGAGGKHFGVFRLNSPIPTSRTFSFKTSESSQKAMGLELVQATNDEGSNVQPLAFLEISGLAECSSSPALVDIVFEVDSDGILYVDGRDPITRQSVRIDVRHPLDGFSEESVRVILESRNIANSLKQNCVGIEHLMYALLTIPSKYQNMLIDAGFELTRVQQEILSRSFDIPEDKRLRPAQIPPTPNFWRVLRTSKTFAASSNSNAVTPADLLLAINEAKDSACVYYLNQMGLDLSVVCQKLADH